MVQCAPSCDIVRSTMKLASRRSKSVHAQDQRDLRRASPKSSGKLPQEVVEKLAAAVQARDMGSALELFGRWKHDIKHQIRTHPRAALLADCSARLLDRDLGHGKYVDHLLRSLDRSKITLLDDAMHVDLAAGIALLHKSKYSDAINLFDLVKRNADRKQHLELMAASRYYLARCHYKSGDYTAALALAKEAHEKCDQLGQHTMMALIDMVTAWVLFIQGNEEAEGVLQRAAKVLRGAKYDYVEDANILSFQGRVECHKGMYKAAIEKFDEAIDRFRANEDVRHPNLARCYVHKALTQALLAQSLADEPKQKDVRQKDNEVKTLRKEALGLLHAAAEIYQAIGHGHPSDRFARLNYVHAVLAYDAGDYANARRWAEKAQQVDDGNPVARIHALIMECRCLIQIGEPSFGKAREAEKLARETASRRLKVRANICVGMAMLAERDRNVQAAEKCLQAAQKEIHEDADYLRNELMELESELRAARAKHVTIIEVTNHLVDGSTLDSVLAAVEDAVVQRQLNENLLYSKIADKLDISRNRLRRIVTRITAASNR